MSQIVAATTPGGVIEDARPEVGAPGPVPVALAHLLAPTACAVVENFETSFAELAALWAKPCTFPVWSLRNDAKGCYEKPAGLEGFSPCKYAPESTDDGGDWYPRGYRSEANVLGAYAVGIEFDSGVSFDEAKTLFGRFDGLAYTTFNHTPEKPRVRVLVGVSRVVAPHEYEAVWTHLHELAGRRADTGAKDVCRFWYAPGAPEGREGDYRIARLEGAALDVDAVLTSTSAKVAPAVVTAAVRVPVTLSDDVEVAVARAKELAAAAEHEKAAIREIAKVWPALGHRHDAKLPLAGGLSTEGYTDARARDFVRRVGAVVGCTDDTDGDDVVGDTFRKVAAGEKVEGWPTLGRLVDAPDAIGRAEAHLELSERHRNRAAFPRRAGLVTANDNVTTAQVPVTVAPVVVPPATQENVANGRTVQAAPGLVIRHGGWRKPLEAVPYLIESPVPGEAGYLVRASVNMLVAEGGSLKTWVALSMLGAVASGKTWLGRYPIATGDGPTGALLLDYEGGDHETRRRVHKLKLSEADDFGYVEPEGIYLHDPKLWESLPAYALVVVDTLQAGSPGTDENDTSAALPIAFARQYVKRTDACVVFVHHTKKGASDGAEAVRGSSALGAGCDSIYRFSKVYEEGTERHTSMFSVKTKRGPKPKTIDLVLSDADGLHFRKTPEGATKTRTPDDMKSTIRKMIGSGVTVACVDELARAMHKGPAAVRPIVNEMLAAGELVKIGRRFEIDNEALRQARVFNAVTAHFNAAEAGLTTARKLAQAAYVSVEDVENFHRLGIIGRDDHPGSRYRPGKLPETRATDSIFGGISPGRKLTDGERRVRRAGSAQGRRDEARAHERGEQ